MNGNTKWILAAVGLLVLIVVVGTFNQNRNERIAYPAWVKITGKTNITFEEWRALKRTTRNSDTTLIYIQQ